MLRMTRRDFLQKSALFAVGLPLLGKEIFAAREGDASVGASFIVAPQNAEQFYSQYPANIPKGPSTVFTDLQTGKTRFLPGVDNGHSVLAIKSKSRGLQLAIIPKHAKQALIVDPADGRILATFTSTADRDFFGHGIASRDGRYIFCSESSKDKLEGLISVRDGETGKLVDQFPSFGQNPHEMAMMQDQKTLLVANAGPLDYDTKRDGHERTSMAYIDVNSKKLSQRLLSKTPNVKLAHFAQTSSGRIFVGGVPGTKKESIAGRVMTSDGSSDLVEMPIPAELLSTLVNETLSVVTSDDIVAASMPFSDRVLVWDARSLKFKHEVKVKHPTGLFMAPDRIVVGADLGQWTEINVGSGKVVASKFKNALAGNQTHITAIF